ncbi:MAG: hypothetical protein R3253_17550 [Longimicrobiales bacterium]|nr:hypothetical protein [Longimicrobiales bacterium]
MRTPSTMRVILSLATLLVVATPLVAQDRRERRPSPQDRQEMEQRLRAQMSRMIRSELGLTEVEYEPVASVMEEFLAERRALWRSERELRRNVQALMESEEEEPAEAAELLRRMSELREREASIFQEEQEALLELLTPTQVLQLHTLRENISRRVRALRGRRGGPAELERPMPRGVDSRGR